jgi:hypothetical protein
MRNLEKWVGGSFPVDGWAERPVTWVAGARDGFVRYAKTHQGVWYVVTPLDAHIADNPVRITDVGLIVDLEAFIAIRPNE